MPSMYPGMYTSPDDPNRGPARRRLDPEAGWPAVLRVGYYLCVAAAIVMVLSGMVLLTTDASETQQAADATAQLLAAFERNLRFLGIINIVAGLLIAALAAQLKSGGIRSRRILLVIIAACAFLNLAAFAIRLGGFGVLVIVVLLALAAFLIFRPEANEYFALKNGREY